MSLAATAETTPAPKRELTPEEKATRSRNRAHGYIFKLRKLIKAAVPVCLANAPGWEAKVEEIAVVLNDIESKHQDHNPACPEQIMLNRLQQELQAFCAAAVGNDPSWLALATKIEATVGDIEQVIPVNINPAGSWAASHPPRPPQIVNQEDGTAAGKERPPLSPEVILQREAKQAQDQAKRSRNRAHGYIFRLKKLLKPALPACLASTAGWENQLAQIVTLLEEIATQHQDLNPDCIEQQFLNRLHAEVSEFCNAALASDPRWAGLAHQLTATQAEIDVVLPVHINPPAVTTAPARGTMAMQGRVARFPRTVAPQRFPAAGYMPQMSYAQGMMGMTGYPGMMFGGGGGSFVARGPYSNLMGGAPALKRGRFTPY